MNKQDNHELPKQNKNDSIIALEQSHATSKATLFNQKNQTNISNTPHTETRIDYEHNTL